MSSKLKLGTKVLIKDFPAFADRTIGTIVEHTEAPWQYGVMLPTKRIGDTGTDVFFFSEQELIPVPKNATKDQIKALQNICNKNLK